MRTMRHHSRILVLVVAIWFSAVAGGPSSDETLICGLVLHEMLHIAGSNDEPRHFVACQPFMNGRSRPHSYRFPREHGINEYFTTILPRLQQGENIVLGIQGGRIYESTLEILENATIEVVEDVHPNERRLEELTTQSTRQLKALVIRILALDAEPTLTAEDLQYLLWDAPVSLRSQLSACSFGKLSVEPTEYGVIDVPVSLVAQKSDYIDLINTAYDSSLDVINADVSDIREVADLVMFVVPPGTGDWVAFGAIPGQQSVFNNEWAGYLGATAHEIGHNLGLRHSWQNGISYGDVTGYMGSAVRATEYPRRCYNGQNHWHLGWFADRSISVDASTTRLYSIAAFVDYELTTTSQYVLLHVAEIDLYLQYNRAKRFNIDSGEYQDRLTIVQTIPDGTKLLAGLNKESPLFLLSEQGQTLVIELCNVNNSNDGQLPDLLTVSVGFDESRCSDPVLRDAYNEGMMYGGASSSKSRRYLMFLSIGVAVAALFVLSLVLFICLRKRQTPGKRKVLDAKTADQGCLPSAIKQVCHPSSNHWPKDIKCADCEGDVSILSSSSSTDLAGSSISDFSTTEGCCALALYDCR